MRTGTGKTDVAVQIIVNLYHNCPTQRTLLVTHSNQALNDLFQKIMVYSIHPSQFTPFTVHPSYTGHPSFLFYSQERDLDQRYLLRLGHGEKSLAGEADFSKFGRVNYMLQRRMWCLERVAQLGMAIGLTDEVWRPPLLIICCTVERGV